MPRLYLLSGSDVGKSFDVAHGATFGRSAECTVHLHDVSVSRLHARLDLAGERWTIVDLESRNGLSIAGERVASAPLSDGDEFTLGDVLLRFRAESVAPPPIVATPAPQVEEASVELEGDWSGATMKFPAARPLAETAVRPTPRAPATPVTTDRSRPVLQYQRVEQRAGLLNADLSQLSVWTRWGLYALALIVAAALFFVAFKGTLFLKERAPGNAPELPASGE